MLKVKVAGIVTSTQSFTLLKVSITSASTVFLAAESSWNCNSHSVFLTTESVHNVVSAQTAFPAAERGWNCNIHSVFITAETESGCNCDIQSTRLVFLTAESGCNIHSVFLTAEGDCNCDIHLVFLAAESGCNCDNHSVLLTVECGFQSHSNTLSKTLHFWWRRADVWLTRVKWLAAECTCREKLHPNLDVLSTRWATQSRSRQRSDTVLTTERRTTVGTLTNEKKKKKNRKEREREDTHGVTRHWWRYHSATHIKMVW